MRALLAGVCVFTVTLAVVGVIGSHYPGSHWPWWGGPLVAIAMIGSLVTAFFLFNVVGRRRLVPGKSAEEQIAELKAKGFCLQKRSKPAEHFRSRNLRTKAHIILSSWLTGASST